MSLTSTDALMLAQRAQGMSADEAALVLDLLMHGSLSPDQGATILVAWAQRGETGIELAAVVNGLLTRAVQIPGAGPAFDLCGTGGSKLTRFNVSTTVAFILATAGVPVAKHGNKGSARPNGSFDLLDMLEIPYQLPPTSHAQLLRKTNLCFLFARAMHPAVAAVAPFRKLAATQVPRTIFNLAGPLANPCRPDKQLIGVTNDHTAHVVTEALILLGAKRAVVVKGAPGIDEVSITGPTHAWEIHHGHSQHHIISGLHHHGLEHQDLPGGDAEHNAPLFRRILTGKESGPLVDMILANAAVALDCWHDRPAHGRGQGLDTARALLASGQVADTLARYQALAKELAH